MHLRHSEKPALFFMFSCATAEIKAAEQAQQEKAQSELELRLQKRRQEQRESDLNSQIAELRQRKEEEIRQQKRNFEKQLQECLASHKQSAESTHKLLIDQLNAEIARLK